MSECVNNFLKLFLIITGPATQALRALMTYYLQNNSLTFEEFIDRNQHEIYHLSSNNKCCQCENESIARRKTPIQSAQMEVLFDTDSQITSSSNKRKDNHDYRKKDKCCCYAKSEICVDGLDITLLKILLLQFCDLFFWTCFLNAVHSGSFEQFLKDRQHELFHLWEPKVTCCECNKHRNTYKRPKIPAISRQEFESLYTFDRTIKQSGCTLDDTCAYAVRQGISQNSIQDSELFQIMKKCLCPHRIAIRGIVEARNKCLHSTEIPENEFKIMWETLKNNILRIETITGSQLWTEESINKLKTKLEIESILNQIKTFLEKLTRSQEDLLKLMVPFKSELRKDEMRKRESRKRELRQTGMIKRATGIKTSQPLASLSYRNYKQSSICLHPKQLKLKLSTRHVNDEIENAENRLKENCHNLNLSFRKETSRDGNCLFEAVASQLSDLGIKEMSAQEMRQEVIEYLMENRDFEGVDGTVNIEHFIDNRPFEDWANNMRQNGVFADHIVVVGIANMLETNMLIVTSNPESNPDNCMTHIVGSRNYRGVPILLGHVWENHYYSLMSVDGSGEKDRLEEHTLQLCEMQSQHQKSTDGSLSEDDKEVVSADINVTLAGGIAIREMKIKGKEWTFHDFDTAFTPAVQTIEATHSSSYSQLRNFNRNEDSGSDEDNLFMCGKCKDIFTTNEGLEKHQKESLSCKSRKRKKEKTSDTSHKSSKQTQNLTSEEPKKRRLKLKIRVEGERDETVPAFEDRVKRVQRICTGDLDVDDEVIVEYVEEGSLVIWTKANASVVQSKRKFVESMDRFMGNLIDKCPIANAEEGNLTVNVDVVESSGDASTNDDDSNLYICGRCKLTFKSLSSFNFHKRDCNLRRTKLSKYQHRVDDDNDNDDSSKGQKRKENESSAPSDTAESEEHSFAQSREEFFVDRLKIVSQTFKCSSTDNIFGYETDKKREDKKNTEHERALIRVSKGVLKDTLKHSSTLEDSNTCTEDVGYLKSSKQPLDHKSTKYLSARRRRTLKKIKKPLASDLSDREIDDKHIFEINHEWNDEEDYYHNYTNIHCSSDDYLEDYSVIHFNDEIGSDNSNKSAHVDKGNENRKQKQIKVKEDYYGKSKAVAIDDKHKKLIDTQMIQYGLNLSERCCTSLSQKKIFRRFSNKFRNFYTPFIEDKVDLQTKCNDYPKQFRKGTLEIRSSHEAICTLEKPLNGAATVEILGRSKCGKAFTDDEVVVQIYQITDRPYIHRVTKVIQGSAELFGEVIGCLKRNRYNGISHPVFVCELDKFEFDKAKPICKTLPKFFLLSENKEKCPFSIDVYTYNENTQAISYDKSIPVSPALRQRYLFYVAYISWNSLYPLGAIIKVHESTREFETGLKILELRNSVPTLYSNDTINYLDFDIKYMDDKSKRIDLTEDCNVFTIDPVGSKVLDDAVSIKELDNGEWRVGVHITDVSVFVEQNCALDFEARHRGTTFFRGQFSDPHEMLPEPICTERCSLVESKNRLALTIFYHFDKDLNCIHKNTKCFKSIIQSRCQLSYEKVQDIIENDSQSPLKKEVLSLFEIAKSLRKKRLGYGMFSIPFELEFFQNKENSTNYPEAYFLIEELMILTNHSVTSYLMRTFPDCIPLRCQDPPSMTRLIALLAKYPKVVDMVLAFQHFPHEREKKICIDNFFNGYTKLRCNDITYVQKWLWKSVIDHLQAGDNKKAAKLLLTEELHPLHALIIDEWKSIQNPSEYRCSGYIQGVKGKHFTLGMFPYTHSTAPNRRFTDLVVHRLLHAAIDGQPSPYSCEEIKNICHDVNTALQRAQEYNNECKSYLFAHTLQSDPQIFHAYIEDCNEKEISLLIPGCNFLKKHCRTIKLNLLGVSEQPKFKMDVDKLNSAANRKYMQLTWKKRIYSVYKEKPYPKHPLEGYIVSKKGCPQKIDPNQKIDFKQTSVWLEYIKRIIDGKELRDLKPEGNNLEPGEQLSTSFLYSAIDTENDVNSEIIDPTKKTINERKIFITEQFCNFSMNFHHGQVVAVQLSSEMQKGLLTPCIDILDMTKNVKYCLKHGKDPIGCFAEFPTTSTSIRYTDYKEYIDIWTPIMKMETAMTIVKDNTIVVNDLPIRFDAKGGNFILRSDFCFERNIDLSDTTVYGFRKTDKEWAHNSDYLCIKCPVSAASGEFLHIRKFSAPHDYKILTNHARITRVSKLRNNTEIEQLKVCFEFIKTERRSLSLTTKTLCSVEIMQKPEFHKRWFSTDFRHSNENQLYPFLSDLIRYYYEADFIQELLTKKVKKRVDILLNCLDISTDLAQAIALNRQTKPIDEDHTKAISSDDIDISLPWNNEQQTKAIHLALRSSFSLIHGPPGTGKTNVGIKLICLFNEINKQIEKNGGDRMQILFCGPSNKSVDLVASRFLRIAEKKEKMPTIARLYGNSIENLNYPIPGRVFSTERTKTDNTADYRLKDVSLHHLIRKPDKPFSEKIQSMYKELTQTFAEVTTTMSDKIKTKTPARKEKNEVKQVVDMETLKDYNQLVIDATIEELKRYDVIFCTTAMSTDSKLLRGTDGRIYQVIIDESGMCTEPECMSTIIATKAKQVVLIGDHKQLQPVVVCPQARQLGLQKSLFERYKTDSHFVPLTTQYRMHPSILEFPARRFYEQSYFKTDVESKSYVEEKPLQVWLSENIRTVFCHVEGVEETLPVSLEEGNEMSRINTAEVAQVMKVYRHLHDKEKVFTTKGKKNEITINIMSQYNAQCSAIHSALEKAKFRDVSVNTVVSSQGGEWDYVIFSLARSLPDCMIEKNPTLGWCAKNLGLITDEHQINVALTRARKGLFIIGNKKLLRCHNTWKDLINTYDRKGCVINGNEYPWPYEPPTRKKKRPKHKHEVDKEGYQQV